MNHIYIYSGCSTCRKAKKWLISHQIDFIEHPIVEETPDFELLSRLIKLSRLPIQRFFNTSGENYRNTNLKEKLLLISDDEKILLLANDGMLIKRPILYNEKQVLIGFCEEDYETAFIAR